MDTELINKLKALRPQERRMVAGLLLISEMTLFNYIHGKSEPTYTKRNLILEKCDEILATRK